MSWDQKGCLFVRLAVDNSMCRFYEVFESDVVVVRRACFSSG